MWITSKSIRGRPHPARALLLDCNLKWDGLRHVSLVSIEGKWLHNDRVVSDGVQLDRHPSQDGRSRIIEPKGSKEITLRVSVAPEAIAYIESVRAGGDLPLRIELSILLQSAHFEDGPGLEPDRQSGIYWSGEHISRTEFVSSPPIPRSDWVRVLAELGWCETEIFEVPAIHFEPTEESEAAIRYLKQADVSLRIGHFADCVTNCRSACESLAKHLSGGDVRAGFEVMLDRAFGKGHLLATSVDGVLRALADLSNKAGRHAQLPDVVAGRDEALLVMRGTLAVFAYVAPRVTSPQ